jgi:hypothetical protein
LADTLAAADVHVVTLLPGLDGLIFPSKIYGIMAAGRPLLYIGGNEGSIALGLSRTGGVVVAAVGDVVAAAGALRKWCVGGACAHDAAGAGQRLRACFEQAQRAKGAAASWERVLVPVIAARCMPQALEDAK